MFAPAIVRGDFVCCTKPGRRRILEVAAKTPHQRVPLIMGSARGVRDVAASHEKIEPMFDNNDAPLFARRGLFL